MSTVNYCEEMNVYISHTVRTHVQSLGYPPVYQPLTNGSKVECPLCSDNMFLGLASHVIDQSGTFAA